jgi:hypothetical protein
MDEGTCLNPNIHEMVMRVMVHRTLENYLGTALATPNGPTVVAGEELPGNLGSKLFEHAGNPLGQRLIAASSSIRYEFKDYLEIEGIDALLISPLDDEDMWIECDGEAIPIMASISADPRKNHDSEYLLMNALAWFMDKSDIDAGELHLMTERIPCKSCTNIISKFKGRYSKVNISVYFLHETQRWHDEENPTRTPADFLQETRGLNVALSKIEISAAGGA